MSKFEHQSVLLQELRVESSKCFAVDSQLLLITPHSQIGVDVISHLRIVAPKKSTKILSQLSLTQDGLK